jgi:acetolactate synthase-1/3 small subunit
VVDISPTTATIELSGSEDKVTAMIELLEEYGILEIVRTGQISIERGDECMKSE